MYIANLKREPPLIAKSPNSDSLQHASVSQLTNHQFAIEFHWSLGKEQEKKN